MKTTASGFKPTQQAMLFFLIVFIPFNCFSQIEIELLKMKPKTAEDFLYKLLIPKEDNAFKLNTVIDYLPKYEEEIKTVSEGIRDPDIFYLDCNTVNYNNILDNNIDFKSLNLKDVLNLFKTSFVDTLDFIIVFTSDYVPYIYNDGYELKYPHFKNSSIENKNVNDTILSFYKYYKYKDNDYEGNDEGIIQDTLSWLIIYKEKLVLDNAKTFGAMFNINNNYNFPLIYPSYFHRVYDTIKNTNSEEYFRDIFGRDYYKFDDNEEFYHTCYMNFDTCSFGNQSSTRFMVLYRPEIFEKEGWYKIIIRSHNFRTTQIIDKGTEKIFIDDYIFKKTDLLNLFKIIENKLSSMKKELSQVKTKLEFLSKSLNSIFTKGCLPESEYRHYEQNSIIHSINIPAWEPVIFLPDSIVFHDEPERKFRFAISPYYQDGNLIEGRIFDSGKKIGKLESKPLDEMPNSNISKARYCGKREYIGYIDKNIPKGKYLLEITHKLASKVKVEKITIEIK